MHTDFKLHVIGLVGMHINWWSWVFKYLSTGVCVYVGVGIVLGAAQANFVMLFFFFFYCAMQIKVILILILYYIMDRSS